ncbi:MAG TPA: CVNH domain-containing protein [Candidatus Angelobacter sp.]|nr:CVNH domain-containing protein [Candidatus Angelobacter sp.]
MKFEMRHALWVLAISAALLATPEFSSGYQPQDNHGGQDRSQDDKRGDQQGDRHDNAQNDQRNDRHDNNQNDRYARNGAPRGGYTLSCQDIRTVGGTLQASCKKRNGKWKQASLRNFNQCVSQIENNNGKLVCSR